MKRVIVVAAVAAGLLALSAAAFGALPKKGGHYVGDIKSSPFAMHIDLNVNAAGTKMPHFTYLCGTGRAPTSVYGIPIDKTGHFKYAKMTGSITVWKIAGRFLAGGKAFISLNSLACGGSKGSTTLHLK
jgi:hypothetical protein